MLPMKPMTIVLFMLLHINQTPYQEYIQQLKKKMNNFHMILNLKMPCHIFLYISTPYSYTLVCCISLNETEIFYINICTYQAVPAHFCK